MSSPSLGVQGVLRREPSSRRRATRRGAASAATAASAASAALMSSLAALVTLVGALSIGIVAVPALAPAAGAANWAPVTSNDFPDPSVLTYQGSYYAFATQNTTVRGTTINIQESTSSDGHNWTQLNTDALPTLGSWATHGDTWAPSVRYDSTDNRFVMYYTATESAAPGEQCIGVATAPSNQPLGPYQDSLGVPIVCQDGIGHSDPTINSESGDLGGSIDPFIFTDDSGSSSLLWKNDGNRIGVPTSIWSVPLDSHLLPVSGGQVQNLLTNTQSSWEGSVIEGPDMVETQTPNGGNPPTDSYYLFFSGSVVAASSYGIGWASCSGPAGPCNDQSLGGPLFSSSPGVSGPGGPDVYSLPPAAGQPAGSGQLTMAFAGWKGSTIGYMSCGIRPMYLADLSFSNGTNGTPSLAPAVPAASPAVGPTCPKPPQPPAGYWQVATDGGIFTFGGAQFYGSTGGMHLNQPVVGMAATPDGNGYWLVASDGGIFAYGDAQFYGSTGSIRLNQPIVEMISTLDGGGYWLVARDGGIFAFGDARFYGSAAQYGLTAPITAAAPSFLGGGYWLVDANGQVYSFGDARYEGAPPYAPGGYRITGMAGTSNSNGYWLASANGNVAGYGNAASYGSMYGQPLNGPVVGIAATRDGAGYWLQGSDGGIFTFGDAQFFGSMGGLPLNAPIVGIASI